MSWLNPDCGCRNPSSISEPVHSATFSSSLGISVLKGASMYRQFALKLSAIIESAPGRLPLPHSRYVPEYLLDLGDRLEAGNQLTPADEVILETLYRRLVGLVDAARQYGLTSASKKLARSRGA